jgi:hypothetical protein
VTSGPRGSVRRAREGFAHAGRHVPFMNRAYGIYRATEVQRGPAAVSVNGSFAQRRYRDEETPDGIVHR